MGRGPVELELVADVVPFPWAVVCWVGVGVMVVLNTLTMVVAWRPEARVTIVEVKDETIGDGVADAVALPDAEPDWRPLCV